MPVGWSSRTLDELADINPESLSGGTSPDFLFDYIDLSSVEKGRIHWGKVRTEAFRGAPSRARRVVRPGDVLFGTVRPALQSHGAVTSLGGLPLVASTGFSVIRARKCESSPRFLFHTILGDAVSRAARRMEVGSNYPAVNESDVRVFPVLCPPVPEQRSIANILDTLDETIRETEDIIAKLRQMKTGLLHDLLSRGVEESGELRPPSNEAPCSYRDSSLGRIPKSWTEKTLGECADWFSGGTPSKAAPGFWGGRIPWVSPKDMKSFVLSATEDHVTEAGVMSGSRMLPSGTVLVVTRGMILAHTFPVCLTSRQMAFNQDVKAARARQGLQGYFLAYWLLGNAETMLRLVTEATHGTKRIDSRALLESAIWIPPIREQSAIVSMLAAHDQRIAQEDTLLLKLRGLKLGLAADLLNGRVRAPVAEGGRT